MIVGLSILLFVVIYAAGGIEPAIGSIDPQRLQLFGGPDKSWLQVAEQWAIPIFGSVLAQELVAVILASHSPQIARRTSLLGGSIYLAVGLIPVVIGLVGLSLMADLAEPEQLMPLLAQKYLAAIPFIVFMGALISAILSTVSSALLAAASLLSHNIFIPLSPGMSSLAKVRLARVCVVAGGVIAFALARHAGGVYELVEQASAFGSAGVFTVVVFGLFTTLGRIRAAYGALIAGVATWIVSHYLLDFSLAYLTSLAAALGVYVLLALTEQRAPKLATE